MRKRGRRLLLGALIGTMVSALVLGASTPALACSCGAIALPDGVGATSEGSRVLVRWDGRVESIDLGLDLRIDSAAPAGTVGFVLPTPRRATVELGDGSLLAALDEVTAPIETVEDDWWGRRDEPPAIAIERAPRAAAPVLDTGTVAASDRAGLTEWLKARDLHLAAGQRDRIADYARRGWSLAMVSIDASAAIDGELDAIRFSFATDEPVLPMQLAAAGSVPAELSVAVLSESRTRLMQSPRERRNLDAAQSVLWAGSVRGTALAEHGSYLTVTRLRFDAPASQVVSDIAIVPAAADDQVIPTTVTYSRIALFGIPLGWLLVGWGGVGLLVGIGYLVSRLRAT